MSLTQLPANRDRAIPTSAHAQEPRVRAPVGKAHETLPKGSLGKGIGKLWELHRPLWAKMERGDFKASLS